MSTELSSGLSARTLRILTDAGYTTRAQLDAAEYLTLLKLPGLGRSSIAEIYAYLGRYAPEVEQDIARARRFLEAHGYCVEKVKPADCA